MNPVVFLTVLTLVALYVASVWLVFLKAGEPGWAAIVPIYHTVVLLRLVGRSPAWIVAFFIPLIAIIAWAVVAVDLAKSFGKGFGFAVGLWLLPFIFVPILGFGRATYRGPANAATWGQSLTGF